MITSEIKLISKELDSCPKYHVLEPTGPYIAQSAEHWASIPKGVGSTPTVVSHVFSMPGVDINELRVTPQKFS